MLLTLAATSFRAALRRERPGPKSMSLTDLPRYAREHLGLFGLNVATEFLAGADLSRLDALREAADKAQCPILVLVESEVQPLGHASEERAQAGIDRVVRVARAAQRLGCSSAAVSIAVADEPAAMDVAAARLKRALQAADRLEVNVLISPSPGLTANPDRLTELIKKVGGFRIGTFPDFQTASKSPDPIQYLRRLTPYAAAVSASIVNVKASRKAPGAVHEPYDLVAFAEAVAAVGYTGTLAIDYRGEGEAAEAIIRARTILETVVGTEGVVE
jgi:sugar phosphate isomerase/epimerase